MKTSIGVLNLSVSTSQSGFQVLPAGEFRAQDGRPKDAPHWFVKNPQALQTLRAKSNGQPAPAAGWVAPNEYRFISPVFRYNQAGEVVELLHMALTNDPALDGMDGVVAAASNYFLNEDDSLMDKKILAALGLDEEASVDDAVAKIAALQSNDKSTDLEQQVADLTTQLEAAKTSTPNPAKYVSVELMNSTVAELSSKIEVLEHANQQSEKVKWIRKRL